MKELIIFTEYFHRLLLKNELKRKYEISAVYMTRMTKVTGLKKKNIYIYIEKRTHGLGVVCINGGGSALFFAIF